MTQRQMSERKAQNFKQQMDNVPSILNRLHIPKGVPCPKCTEKGTLKLDHEQPKTEHTLGIDLNYRCTSCGCKVESKVEF